LKPPLLLFSGLERLDVRRIIRKLQPPPLILLVDLIIIILILTAISYTTLFPILI